jgi:hypothetical protein
MRMNLKISRMKERPLSARLLLLGGGAALAATWVRWAALPPMLPDLDAVNFARALQRFDLVAQAPHFPGYPVYVAMTRGVSWTGVGDVLALALPGLLLSSAAGAALAMALRRHLATPGLIAGAVLWALLPMPVLFGATPGSDGAGVALLVLSVAASLALPTHAGWGAVGAGVLAALALGARPSYLVAIVALVGAVPRGSRALWAVGAALCCASWLVPMVLLIGPTTLWRVATAFVGGHAGEWGGTVAVRPNLVERMELFAFDVGAAGLGGPAAGAAEPARWIVALTLLLLLAAVAHAALTSALTSGERRIAMAALWLGVPYAACMFVGQNLLKSRHALPIVVAIALLAAVGASSLWRRRNLVSWSLVSGLSAALMAVTLPLARAQAASPSPAGQLVRHVDGTLPAAGTVLFTGEEARLFEHYAPYFRAGRPGTADQLAREVALVSSAGAAVYVTSEAPGVERLRDRLVPVARFECSRLVRSHAHALVLYRFAPEPGRRRESVL